MKKKVVSLFITVLMLVTIQAVVSANDATTQYPESFLGDSTRVFALTQDKSLFVDTINNQLQVVNLNTQQKEWGKNFKIIYDCDILANPSKIVILTKENDALLKITLSADGNVLSKQLYPYLKPKDNQKWSWSPARNQVKEQIAILDQEKRQVQVYQYPWKKPSHTISFGLPGDATYEDILINDIQIQYPYVIIKLDGTSLMQSQNLYRIINLATREKNTIPMEWNVNSDFTIEGNELVVTTSSVTGNPLGINTNVEHNLYARYNLETRLPKVKITRKFTTVDSNWKASYGDNHLMVFDSEQNTQSLLDKNGELLHETPMTDTDLHNRFVGYHEGKIIFLAPTGNRAGKIRITHPNP
ncbi:hypothetical protein DFP94_11658 [Fontibacillus phaseoli]|uniref:Uncharacterized protein n=1 Tax=Fontibacillus phaseoli TaxID=1416533 RepID=A0A369B061_9BACL|nr:hypothetical protein [Fontibacillus phaseoli]RCX14919.1 hypothetical protein DFP94_11658 [Fontibacillus phaseoli]